MSATKNISEAIECYKKATKYKPDFVDALTNLASAYSEVNELEESLSYFRVALKIDADFKYFFAIICIQSLNPLIGWNRSEIP